MRVIIVGCCTLLFVLLPADQSGRALAAATCKLAIVNPVSGYAECVNPLGAPVDPAPPRQPVVKLAVFDFELDDASPAATLLGKTTSTQAAIGKASEEARRMVENSRRYLLVDVPHVVDCENCEAGLAREAGADQALVGVVRRITQTDYYVVVQITDVRTGKVLNQQSANFAGGPDGWASGVRMLLKHQVLVANDPT